MVLRFESKVSLPGSHFDFVVPSLPEAGGAFGGRTWLAEGFTKHFCICELWAGCACFPVYPT